MIHVFCEPDDVAALWLATALSERGTPVTVSLPEELLVGSRFSLEFGAGPPRPSATLASGASLSPEDTSAIVARMTAFPLPDLQNASDADLVYGAEEARAALVGWFAAWTCPVIGRPDPYTPWGDGASLDEWRLMAARSGVAVLTQGAATDDGPLDLLATSDGVFGAEGRPAEPALAAPARTLFTLQGDAAAVFRFHRGPDGPLFDAPVPMADFRAFGAALPDMLAERIAA